MSGYPSREQRHTVWLGARLKSRGSWSDVTIRNVSSGGIMASCSHPPKPGEWIEVRCGSFMIVARVVWATDDRFGASTQDRIVLEDLLRASRSRPTSGERRRNAGRGEQGAFAGPSGVSARA